MSKPEKNPFDNNQRLLLPLWSRLDEFEDFLVMSDSIFHITNYVDNPWEHWTDYMYHYQIEWNDIWVQCIFYQDFSREENEKEKKETVYIWIDKVFTKWIKWWDSKLADNYEDWELTKEQQEWHDELVRLNTLHLIEDDNKDRYPHDVAKIKSFLFYQTLWKDKAKELIKNEIEKLWDKALDIDIKELNEIMETWTIKRPKHYEQLYWLKNVKEWAEWTDNPELPKIEEQIRELEADQ